MKTIKKDECSYSFSNAIRTLAMVWQSESGDILFCISAALPESEMVKIAESIEKGT